MYLSARPEPRRLAMYLSAPLEFHTLGSLQAEIEKNPPFPEWSFSYRFRTKLDTFGGLQLQLISWFEKWGKVHT